MRSFPVAFPARPHVKAIMECCRHCKQFRVMNKISVTSNAILVYNPFPIFLNKNALWFKPQCKHICMPKSILSLEVIFIENIIMRYMAIITICNFPV